MKGIISGSFIIQSILKTYWAESDIDIYIPMKENVMAKIEESGNMKTEMEDFLYSNMEFHGSTEWSKYQNVFEGNIYFTRTYKKIMAKYHVQVILVDTDVYGLHKFIKNNFDFDICKNAFWNYDSADNINIFVINDILDKQAKFAFGKNIVQSYNRCKKYINRGFSFTDKYISDINIYHLCDVKQSIYKIKLCDDTSFMKTYKIISDYYPDTIIDMYELQSNGQHCYGSNFYEYYQGEHSHTYICRDDGIQPIVKTCNNNCKKKLYDINYWNFPIISNLKLIFILHD